MSLATPLTSATTDTTASSPTHPREPLSAASAADSQTETSQRTTTPPSSTATAASSGAFAGSLDDEQTWRQFIGPKADHYLSKFRQFTSPTGPKYALTWNWAAFAFEPFLWFLYRKMYLYAAVYAIGPLVAFYFTMDVSADIVWRFMAGASANYLYYWHIREQLADIRRQAGLNAAAREQLIHDAGGVQPYVVWVGIGLLVLKIVLLSIILHRGGDDLPIPAKPKAIQSQATRLP
ncbi:MAG: DUF2628 domain-containing protein [Nitrospiraceae bacterium]